MTIQLKTNPTMHFIYWTNAILARVTFYIILMVYLVGEGVSNIFYGNKSRKAFYD